VDRATLGAQVGRSNRQRTNPAIESPIDPRAEWPRPRAVHRLYDRGMDPEAVLAGLNDEQCEAATATTGPVVILAGAGTGKTRVIS
jgi:hypothetical protein